MDLEFYYFKYKFKGIDKIINRFMESNKNLKDDMDLYIKNSKF